ncbi:tautomerase family protein [Bradyrhizobium sp. ISRA443]|uniref:tautomerase family protein n=1 Tax=unclassified Bradyrhizobium TaxID=2631580 RepID=UPI0024798181|nr:MULTISPECIES: tautomerase family protein [unclassified Bradyrhizobium]WGR94622.1 tautomerase family protein [Bradyrhizobium sp. ISRA435]WGR99407.1 tautomerase family protein [Bradyrhizobium sp. ISRA436]WGS06298.1 tautomerase family protein [Bradyrhizobium sp. ISRA437]WGS13182.1 tautomerase family protein [Bradyrhizobium sp. ISRA443]
MPLVNISLLKGKSKDHIRAIADGVHQALMDTYSVPPGDRFQFIRQHEREEFIYDPDYLGIHRTDDVVFIHIVAGNWRDTATKKALYRAIADRLVEKPGLRREDVQIILSPNARDEWSFGNGLASYLQDTDPA